MSFELFYRYWNPHQVKINCTCSLQARRPKTVWNKKVDDVDSWLSHHQPIRRMLEDPGMLSFTLSLKIFPWKPLRVGLLSISYLDSLLGACSKHYTCLHHNLVSVNWLHYAQVKPVHRWTQQYSGKFGFHSSFLLHFYFFLPKFGFRLPQTSMYYIAYGVCDIFSICFAGAIVLQWP